MATNKPSKSSRTGIQHYPRLDSDLLDDTKLVQHPEPRHITPELLRTLIIRAIKNAEQKSRRAALELPPNLSPEETEHFYEKQGRELFEYFHKYPTDPAATAHDYHRKNYREVGTDLFRRRTQQKGRMNSGWRYQFLAQECAAASGRFRNTVGFSSAQGDFVALIDLTNLQDKPVHLYVSVKNRRNTLGGQDWPKAISALEEYAKADKNKVGPYCCVFGIAIDRGGRSIPGQQNSDVPRSVNTEIWLSDFFWPFFSAYNYEEIMTAVLETLMDTAENGEALATEVNAPDEVLNAFRTECERAGLIDDSGNFNDALKLVHFFCNAPPPKPKASQKKVTKSKTPKQGSED